MSTALGLYGGFMRINWLCYGGPETQFSVGAGALPVGGPSHTATEVSRTALGSGPDGVQESSGYLPSAALEPASD